MAISPTDKKPDGISLRDAYSAIRKWYQAHIDDPLKTDKGALHPGDVRRQASKPLVQALPPTAAVSDLEIIAVLREVIVAGLEWGFTKSDAHYIMGAYARSALETLGRSYSLTSAETEELRKSVLWPFLKRPF